jgi:anti-sigma factor RsiW
MDCKRADNLLDAFLDSELDPLHSLEIEAHLRECQRCTNALQSRRRLQEALRTHLPTYTAPPDLRRRIHRAAKPAMRFNFRALALAAALLLAVSAATWITAAAVLHPRPDPNAQLALAVESSHLRSLQPGHLTDVLSSDQHTVKPWFAGKLPYTPPVQKLDDQGFPLIGGRLDVIDGQPVCALVYQRRKHTINLFIWPTSESDTSPQPTTTSTGHHILHWNSAGMTWWAVSDLSAEDLQTFASALRAAQAK